MQVGTPPSYAVATPARISVRIPTSPALDGRSIAVVESDDDNRELYEAWLTWSGARVTSYSRGVEALDEIDCNRPDAVIISVRLRGEDGFAVCEALTRRPNAAGIPLIALTTCMSDHERAVRAGMFSTVVMIPTTCETLLSLTSRALRRPRRRLAA